MQDEVQEEAELFDEWIPPSEVGDEPLRENGLRLPQLVQEPTEPATNTGDGPEAPTVQAPIARPAGAVNGRGSPIVLSDDEDADDEDDYDDSASDTAPVTSRFFSNMATKNTLKRR